MVTNGKGRLNELRNIILLIYMVRLVFFLHFKRYKSEQMQLDFTLCQLYQTMTMKFILITG